MRWRALIAASRANRLFAAILAPWAIHASLFAHGDLHEQIEALTAQIEQAPSNAELHLRRGELHQVHGDWPAARADYDKAATLAPGLPGVDLARGRLYFAVGAFGDARKVLDRFLAAAPHHVEGRITRARVLRSTGEPMAAVADFTRAIADSTQPDPDFYIERAEALAAAGHDHLEEALQGLDEGLKRLGYPVTLTLCAIDLEVALQRFDPALRRVDDILGRSPRKETWLVRRGEILEQAKRDAEARAAFSAALAAIDALPEHRRTTKAMVDLRARLENKLHP
jgi:tetratricopeptide (TPR) repeat protein